MGRKAKLSRFISLVLRHKPEEAGIVLSWDGWAETQKLLDGINRTGREIDMKLLEDIVSTDEKGRYAFNEDKTKIRARQGHSVKVDVGLKQEAPPDRLYHGTGMDAASVIHKEGIKKMNRLYVHLSDNLNTAWSVGRRRMNPCVLLIDTAKMKEDGILFFRSENGVWLTEFVPPQYICGLRR